MSDARQRAASAGRILLTALIFIVVGSLLIVGWKSNVLLFHGSATFVEAGGDMNRLEMRGPWRWQCIQYDVMPNNAEFGVQTVTSSYQTTCPLFGAVESPLNGWNETGEFRIELGEPTLVHESPTGSHQIYVLITRDLEQWERIRSQ